MVSLKIYGVEESLVNAINAEVTLMVWVDGLLSNWFEINRV